MTEETTTVERGEKPVFTPDQQAAYEQMMTWLTARDPRALRRLHDPLDPNYDPDMRRYAKSNFQLPPGAEQWFDDNPDDYFILRGYAGTGKTFMLAEMILDLSEQGWTIACTAPTNKAVGVIQEKVRQAAQSRVVAATFSSLHSVCGLRMVENDDGELSITDTGRNQLANYNVLIVDEASMVDTKTLLRSVQNGRGACLVLFIGDPAQLQPVQEGTIARVFRLPQRATLKKIVRQAEGNPLIAASMHIRQRSRIDEIMESADEEEAQWIIDSLGQDDRVTVSELMEFLPQEWFLKGIGRMRAKALELQREGTDARILCYTNKIVLSNNEDMHYDLHPEAEAQRMLFVPGERVIVQSATRGEDIETGKDVDLVTSEELVVLDVERTLHPIYANTKCYQMVLQDDLGHMVKVYVPVLMSQFKNHASELFGEVNDIKHRMDRNPRDRSLGEALNRARNAAWAYKNSFAEIRHTYSLTTHKSQGSTYDISLIDFNNLMQMQTTINFNAALYVALTRPRHIAYIAY